MIGYYNSCLSTQGAQNTDLAKNDIFFTGLLILRSFRPNYLIPNHTTSRT